MLAAAALNFKRVMNLWKKEAIYSWQLIYNFFAHIYWNFYAKKLKTLFEGRLTNQKIVNLFQGKTLQGNTIY